MAVVEAREPELLGKYTFFAMMELTLVMNWVMVNSRERLWMTETDLVDCGFDDGAVVGNVGCRIV